mmetsp:Transcript_8717/g.9953  ORF Transcript_8717/g.9953 Transcript_8717/m.9953 type:complete len:380 (+) Transcript_8717:141-1280(+)
MKMVLRRSSRLRSFPGSSALPTTKTSGNGQKLVTNAGKYSRIVATNKQSSYSFDKPLKKGLILSRPNRFVMQVLVDGKVERCHCPVTGSIANINFKKINGITSDGEVASTENAIPCLLSKNSSKSAKTAYTVEAISLQLSSTCAYPSTNQKEKEIPWIGINQVRANRFIEHFLRAGAFSELLQHESLKPLIEREKTLFGSSRIDFCVDQSHYIEVKCPVNWMSPEPGHPLHEPSKKISTLSDRLIKHHEDLRDFLLGKRKLDRSNDRKKKKSKVQQLISQMDAPTKRRCSVLVVFMYDAVKFRGTESEPSLFKANSKTEIKKRSKKHLSSDEKYSIRLEHVRSVIRSAHKAGLKSYQINLEMKPEGVKVLRMFELPKLE